MTGSVYDTRDRLQPLPEGSIIGVKSPYQLLAVYRKTNGTWTGPANGPRRGEIYLLHTPGSRDLQVMYQWFQVLARHAPLGPQRDDALRTLSEAAVGTGAEPDRWDAAQYSRKPTFAHRPTRDALPGAIRAGLPGLGKRR